MQVGIVDANWHSSIKIAQGAARLPGPFPGNPPGRGLQTPRMSQKHSSRAGAGRVTAEPAANGKSLPAVVCMVTVISKGTESQ